MNAVGPRADAADAQVAQAIHHAADRGEPREIFPEIIRIGTDGMKSRQRIRDTILAQVVAGRHLAAETVAAMQDRHLRSVVGRRLHQHRHVEPRQPQRVGDRALVAEVGQRDDHAVDPVAVLAEQRRAALGFFVGLHRAMFAVFRAENDASMPALSSACIISSRPDFAN